MLLGAQLGLSSEILASFPRGLSSLLRIPPAMMAQGGSNNASLLRSGPGEGDGLPSAIGYMAGQ